MDDSARPVLGEQPVDEFAVADVAANEDMARVVGERRQILGIAGVGEGVEIEDGLVALRQPVEDEIRADEARAAGHQDHVRASTEVFSG